MNPTVWGVSIMTGTVCFAMVALRLVARHYTGNKLWLDDMFQILGAVSRTKLVRCASLTHYNVLLIDCDDPFACNCNHGYVDSLISCVRCLVLTLPS